MSLLPEFVLQQVLVKGIRTLREQPDLIDMLLRNLRQEDVNGVRKYVRDNSFDIALNWPSSMVKIPSIIISLKSESESQAFLGNLIQGPTNIRETGVPFPTDELTSPATTLGSGSKTTVGSPIPGILSDPIEVLSSTSTSFSFAITDEFKVGDPFDVPYGELIAVIREGTGAGQRRRVTEIEVSPITGVKANISMAWGTNPDTSSIIEFQHSAEFNFTGEPSKIYKGTDVLERFGAQYKTSYQSLIIGPDQELTIILYALVKAILFINYETLNRNGMINTKMSGTDFAVRSDYFPEDAYQRALIIEFDHTFDVYLKPEVISQISCDVGVYDPDPTDGSGVGKVALSSTIDLP